MKFFKSIANFFKMIIDSVGMDDDTICDECGFDNSGRNKLQKCRNCGFSLKVNE